MPKEKTTTEIGGQVADGEIAALKSLLEKNNSVLRVSESQVSKLTPHLRVSCSSGSCLSVEVYNGQLNKDELKVAMNKVHPDSKVISSNRFNSSHSYTSKYFVLIED